MKKFLIGILAILYIPTVSLFIMPLVYGQTYIGILAWVPLWVVNIPVSVILHFINEDWRDSFHGILNKAANWCMTLNWRTVSHELGERIDNGVASKIECLHCKILGTFDPLQWHCSPKAKSLI